VQYADRVAAACRVLRAAAAALLLLLLLLLLLVVLVVRTPPLFCSVCADGEGTSITL